MCGSLVMPAFFSFGNTAKYRVPVTDRRTSLNGKQPGGGDRDSIVESSPTRGVEIRPCAAERVALFGVVHSREV